MSDAKIFVWTILLFILVFVKFTLLTPFWLIYATVRYIDQNGITGLDCHFRASFRAMGQMWRKHVFFWLDQE